MLNLRARQYEPAQGRFSQRDSLKGWVTSPRSLNAYLYCQNDAINYFDASGAAMVAVNMTDGGGGKKSDSSTSSFLQKGSQIIKTVASVAASAAAVVKAANDQALKKGLVNSILKESRDPVAQLQRVRENRTRAQATTPTVADHSFLQSIKRFACTMQEEYDAGLKAYGPQPSPGTSQATPPSTPQPTPKPTPQPGPTPKLPQEPFYEALDTTLRGNCYQYATGTPYSIIGGGVHYPGFMNRRITINDRFTEEDTCDLAMLIQDDLNASHKNRSYEVEPCNIDYELQDNEWMIAYCYSPRSYENPGDFHFFRYDKDIGWSHKPGWKFWFYGERITQNDFSPEPEPIIDLLEADLGIYDKETLLFFVIRGE